MYDLYFLHNNTIDKIEKKQIEEKKEKNRTISAKLVFLTEADLNLLLSCTLYTSKQWYMNIEQCFLSRLCRKRCPIVPLQM